ncbi:MAG: DUF779 domain-containing protein [Balneolaceae bacterium]|nr:MAG: DUF779 domain-containing protein [Balneolaceae bacterium]
MDTRKVIMTDDAKAVVDTLREKFGELIFHQSGGCCDGSSPMCFQEGDFIIGASDIKLGSVYGCDFFMAKDQYKYWKFSQLIIDVTEGRGASFSLEIPMGVRFVVKSRLFTDEEWNDISEERKST